MWYPVVQIKSAVHATANGWDMPATIAGLQSSASDHVSLQCQKCSFNILFGVVCQPSQIQITFETREHRQYLFGPLLKPHHLVQPQDVNTDALLMPMIQHCDFASQCEVEGIS